MGVASAAPTVVPGRYRPAMGLAIEVACDYTGMFAESPGGDPEDHADHLERMTRLRAALVAVGVTGWAEPERPPSVPGRPCCGSFPYSYLHHLRRAYALVRAGRPVTPVTGRAGLDADAGVVEGETLTFESHLLCHSDCEGYYVPVDLAEPVLVEDDHEFEGGQMVGSSQGLLRELWQVAPAIGVRLDPGGVLPDAEAERLNADRDDPWETEQVAWLTLHEACTMSIASGCAISFL